MSISTEKTLNLLLIELDFAIVEINKAIEQQFNYHVDSLICLDIPEFDGKVDYNFVARLSKRNNLQNLRLPDKTTKYYSEIRGLIEERDILVEFRDYINDRLRKKE